MTLINFLLHQTDDLKVCVVLVIWAQKLGCLFKTLTFRV